MTSADVISPRSLHLHLTSPELSPVTVYYTAPSSPISPSPISPSFFTPPSSPPHPHNSIPTDDPFPSDTDELSIDVALDDESLTALDKIYLFTTSKAPSHRVFIAHALPAFLHLVAPHDAIQYVLPLLSGLAMDHGTYPQPFSSTALLTSTKEEQVKEALAAELVPLIWWFFSHCQLVPDEALEPAEISPEDSTISVQAFTPILGTLLLSANPAVGASARYAIVEILSRLKVADERETDAPDSSSHPETGPDWDIGLFQREEREKFRNEILQQIVIGMARLDLDVDDLHDELGCDQFQTSPESQFLIEGLTQHQLEEKPLIRVTEPKDQPKEDIINPYFPLVRSHSSPPYDPLLFSLSSTSPPETSGSRSSMTSGAPERTVPTSEVSSSPWLQPSRNGLLFSRSPTEERPPLQHSPSSNHVQEGGAEAAEADLAEQGAVGRLSSMSLMAAVTASGSLDEDIKQAFVKEVERVGQDPIYWVRREASFALGALAKVVPEEIIICSFLPLFHSLRSDTEWHVRHSALFALPAILSRLAPNQRHSLALETILSLCVDDSPVVRSGVLEALGEVLYTFQQDDGGPPEKLLQLFLGRREDRRLRDGQQDPSAGSLSPEETRLESFYNDPERPLVCAFNYPAVALTLGRNRWPEIRGVYRDLATNKANQVQRTLAASLGALAEIIGKDHAALDLVDVWWEVIRHEDNEVRGKALESVGLFTSVLSAETSDVIVQGLVSIWDEGTFKSWRERESIARSLMGLTKSTTSRAHEWMVGLLRRALEDSVAAVRDAAISALPWLWSYLSSDPEAFVLLKGDINSLCKSTIYRRRMTFVACQQALITADYDGQLFSRGLDDELWISFFELASDAIIGVRIGLARLIGYLTGGAQSHIGTQLGQLHVLIEKLSEDPSSEVRSYLPDISQIGSQLAACSPFRSNDNEGDSAGRRLVNLSTFSRPPPTRPIQ